MIYFIIGIGYLIDILFIIHDEKKHDNLSIVLKSLASLSFVLLSIIVSKNATNQLLAKLMIFSLVFDLFGDVVLILRNILPNKHDLIYTIGTLCFFIGHIFLIIMLIINNPDLILKSLIMATFMFLVCFFVIFNKLEMNKLFKVVGGIYLFFIIFILAYSFSSYINYNSKFELSFMFAYFLFCVSDIILMISKFNKKASNTLQPIYRLSYFISQILIALSISLL